MVLETLGEKLRSSLKSLLKGLVGKAEIERFVQEIKRALILADVQIDLVNSLCDRIKKRALKEKPKPGLTLREHVVRIVYEELTSLLGGEPAKLSLESKPTFIMLIGLFGSGKTTSAAKLARFLKKKGYKVALLQTDTWRAAAYDQLRQLAENLNLPFYGDQEMKDPVMIFNKFKEDYPRFDFVIIDTAGRSSLDQTLADELKKLKSAIGKATVILVLSGDIGQAAYQQAKRFNELVGVDGVIVTKLDGTARGGGALSACAATDSKVMFIGVGEKLSDFEEYVPANFVSRLLGMGDIESLLKKAEEVMDKQKASELAEKTLSGKFTFEDLYEQISALSKMGPLSQIAGLLPMGSMIPKELLLKQESALKVWKYIIDSMTKEERKNPDIINASRIKRIAAGSGRSEEEVRSLIRQYYQMRKLMKQFGGKKAQKLAKLLGGKIFKI